MVFFIADLSWPDAMMHAVMSREETAARINWDRSDRALNDQFSMGKQTNLLQIIYISLYNKFNSI